MISDVPLVPIQNEYRSLYTILACWQRVGVDKDRAADEIRRRLRETWTRMSEREREPFLAPGCLER